MVVRRAPKDETGMQVVQAVMVLPFFIITCVFGLQFMFASIEQAALLSSINHALADIDLVKIDAAQNKNAALQDELTMRVPMINAEHVKVSDCTITYPTPTKHTGDLQNKEHNLKSYKEQTQTLHIKAKVTWDCPCTLLASDPVTRVVEATQIQNATAEVAP